MNDIPMGAFQFALENTIDSVVLTDMESVIRWVNPSFTRVTGFPKDEALGSKPSILRSRYTSQATYESMWEVILAGGWWHGELINVRKSGEEWYSWLSISRFADGHGAPMGYVGISRDITEIKRMQQSLKEAGQEALFMLAVACEAKDHDTGSHILRVRHYAHAVARRLGLSDELAEEIGYSSITHDVGKLHVPDDLLTKPGPLSLSERERMARHPTDGRVILREQPFFETARQIAANHHERWDGSGYPRGISGRRIPLPARIVAVVDVFDALTSERPYKAAWSDEAALAELRRERGAAFDPAVVDAFFALYDDGIIQRIRDGFTDG